MMPQPRPETNPPNGVRTEDPLPEVLTGSATGREIAQQPRLWRQVAHDIAAARGRIEAFCRPVLSAPDARVVLAGAGTSAFAGEVLAPFLARRLGIRVDAVATTDLVASPREYLHDVPTLMVSFARSGNSPESVAATRLADQLLTRCHHLVLTCDPVGALHRSHEDTARSLVLLMPPEANDSGFAMTSSFTCMTLAARLALTGADAAEGGELAEVLASSVEAALPSFLAVAARLAATEPERVVYLGSGALAGLAQEAALKLLELTAGRVTTHADTPLGFRHGPKAWLEGRTVVVLLTSADPHTRSYDLDLADELARQVPGDRLVVLSTAELSSRPAGWVTIEGLSGIDDAAVALPMAVLAQLVGLHVAHGLGLAVDNPFPGGEINRVVQGVTIHPVPGSAD